MKKNENEKREKLNKENLTENKRRLNPEEDPAVINPEELASFPKQVDNTKDVDLEEERNSHLVNKQKSPVRSGRNITQTGPDPDRDGFM